MTEKVNKRSGIRPALSPEARENQIISAAMDLAMKQILDGTATSQVVTHFLKLATQKEKLEKDLLEEQVKLARAKTKAVESSAEDNQLYKEAINAMKSYTSKNDFADDIVDENDW